MKKEAGAYIADINPRSVIAIHAVAPVRSDGVTARLKTTFTKGLDETIGHAAISVGEVAAV